jgi:branched-chain amino acid transport system substrate-binding protein
MRRGKLAPVLVGLAVLLAACGTSTPSTTTGSTIIFGAAVSLTGTQSFEGKLTKQGYDLWLDWIKARGGIVIGNVKHPVDIKYEDDQSKADISATLVQKLITDEKANFILGPYGSSATATDAIVVERNGIPMVTGLGFRVAAMSRTTSRSRSPRRSRTMHRRRECRWPFTRSIRPRPRTSAH